MWLTSAQGLSSFISLILHLAVRTCHVVAHCKSILTVSYTGFLLIHCVSTLIHKVSRQREKGVLHWVSGGGRYHCKASNVFSQRVLHNYNVAGFLQLEAVITKSLKDSWLLVNPHSSPSPSPFSVCNRNNAHSYIPRELLGATERLQDCLKCNNVGYDY